MLASPMGDLIGLTIDDDGTLVHPTAHVHWNSKDTVILDGEFTLEQLEYMIVYRRHQLKGR